MSLSNHEKKEKSRWRHILRTYGLTQRQYKNLDKGYCPICGREWDDKVRPVVDHDHKARIVRGILCRYCNHKRLGNHTDAGILVNMARYLKTAKKIKMPKKKPKKKKTKIPLLEEQKELEILEDPDDL